MQKYMLLTGATGLVGRYLLRDLLSDGCRLAVVVRPTKKFSARERIEQIMQMWEAQADAVLPRPVCLEGNVAETGLGLCEEDRRWVAQHCHRVLHNAATLTFHGADRSGDPWLTNLEGTRHVVELMAETGLDDLHYVSTAYVAGEREGTIYEHELNVGQKFRNDYEESKLLAEELVRSAAHVERLTVYRPAVIAGDSVTAYTNTYHGIYMYLKLMSVLVWNTPPGDDGRRYTPVTLPMTGEEKRNIIPVDWVSKVICHCLGNEACHGRTFHMAPEPEDCVTPRKIIEAGYKHFNSYGVEFQPEHEREPITDMDDDAYSNMSMYQEYETTDPVFDLTNLKKYAPHLPCPVIDEAMILRFWKFAEEDRWSKRKVPAPQVNVWAENELRDALAAAERLGGESSNGNGHADDVGSGTRTIGLNVLGPGGGQWHLSLQHDRVAALVRGLPVRELPAEDAPVVGLTADELADCRRPSGQFELRPEALQDPSRADADVVPA